MPPNLLHTLTSYCVATMLLVIYGQEVCPYLEGLGVIALGSVLVGSFTVVFTVRAVLYRKVPPPIDGTRARRQLKMELALWGLAGIVITAWNTTQFQFPIESGLKVLVGTLSLGLFAASHQALVVEETEIERLAANPNPKQQGLGPFLSISTRFLIFSVVSLVLLTLVLLLVIYKDLSLIVESVQAGRTVPAREIAVEITFVMCTVAVGCVMLAHKLSFNIRLIHQLQIAALSAVTGGDYKRFVPVIRNDELGLIGFHTNQMILGLQEKARLQGIFGKLVSPAVAKEILADEQGSALGGREVEAVVLFTDLRNFTGISEATTPEGVVLFLNEYFGMLVSAVYAHDGVVDKFIGDAAMAVFGLEGRRDAADRALKAAVEIHAGMGPVNQRLEEQGLPTLAQGIGLHLGTLIAGNIGSEDRMEYTVIGDTVNTASRLESLTKAVGQPLLASRAVYEALTDEGRAQLMSVGTHQVKGKSEPVEVYGIRT